MSRKEIIKEDIAIYRAYLLLLTTSLFGIVGYAIINIEKLTTTQTILGVVVSIVLSASFGLLLQQYLKTRKILEDME